VALVTHFCVGLNGIEIIFKQYKQLIKGGLMKRTIQIGVCLILFIVLCSCVNKYHPTIEPKYLKDDAILKLNVTHPVAIKNVSIGKDETLLCRHSGHEYFGKLYDVTETTTNIVKNALQRKNIQVDDKADKTLELSVDKITCDSGWRGFTAESTLRARTGNGVEKEYKYKDTYQIVSLTTSAIEVTLSQCVEQLLNDKDIVDYLEQ